jgi:hypothetical protein
MRRGQSAKPNFVDSRPRVIDASDIAKSILTTFNDREVEYEVKLKHGWPMLMQHVGDSLAIAYASDKWQKPGANGKRFVELYKHIAESRNHAFTVPGLLHDFYKPTSGWPSIGPYVSLQRVPLPQHFAILGLFREADLKLHTQGTDDEPDFGEGEDDGIVKVTCGHAMLGASKVLWSEDGGKDEPFLFVYTERDGVLMLFVGEELDVEKDGIVG